ncbi:MAG: signal peptide peptidase SppA [Fibromonadaceae bacterium]|jgi:protease-4|nr:signal peptide peptidase SppA [Fibromonadaceae bacterium]
MPFFLIVLFASTVFASVAGESRYASLSQDGGMQGNPAALNAFGSSGAIFSYGKTGENIGNMDNFLFGIWGSNFGAAFDWTNGKNGYDRSEWSFVGSESNSSRSFFFGSRFSATRVSQKHGTSFLFSPGFLIRPASLVSIGFWSEHAFQYGFYQNRMQNAGFSIRPVSGITASWNANIKNYEQLKHFSSQVRQNILLELEAFDLTLGLEYPLVAPDDNGELRLSLSTALGSHLNASYAIDAGDAYLRNNFNFRKFSLIRHSALNESSLGYSIVHVHLGSISEKSNGWSVFGEQGNDLETLKNTFVLLERSSTRAVLFDFSNYRGGLSISQEIRRGIASLKSRGIKVAAYTNDYRPSIIFAASAADKIILQPSTFVNFKGLASEVLYYKGLLDRVGIKFEMLRHGGYKSAMEPYVLDSMSNEARENLQGVLNGWWSVVRDTVAASRGLSAEFLDSIANNPRTTASSAKNNGLADTLLYMEDVAKYISKVFLGRENKDASMESWYLSGEKIISNSWQPVAKIAVLNIDGMIISGYGSNDPLFGNSVAGVASLIETINDIGYSDEYDALILRINSPGGSAVASDELWHSLKTLRENGMPIIASVGDMAASGAYYTACAADKIVAEAGSVVGSIGIYGGKLNMSGLLAKFRMKNEVVKTHESANAQSVFSGLSKNDSIALQEYMDEFYSRFVSVVSEGRNMSEERVDSLGNGKVYVGIDAVKNGLIDEIGGFEYAVELAKKDAGLRKSAKVEIVHINNWGYSFTDRISAMAKGEEQIYPWLNSLENTQGWAIYYGK